MKVLEENDDTPYLTVTLEAEDFPSRETLQSLTFDVSVLPDEYDGNSSVVSLAHLFIDQMNMLPIPSLTKQDSHLSREIKLDKAATEYRNWRLLTIRKRFGYDLFYEHFSPSIESLLEKNKEDDLTIYDSYLYVVLTFVKLNYDFSSFFGQYAFGEMIGFYKEKYGSLPNSSFLEKLIKEVQPHSYSKNDTENTGRPIFRLSENPDVVVHLTTSYSTEQLDQLINELGVSSSHIKAFNELEFFTTEEIIEARDSIPQEWLNEICPPPEDEDEGYSIF